MSMLNKWNNFFVYADIIILCTYGPAWQSCAMASDCSGDEGLKLVAQRLVISGVSSRSDVARHPSRLVSTNLEPTCGQRILLPVVNGYTLLVTLLSVVMKGRGRNSTTRFFSCSCHMNNGCWMAAQSTSWLLRNVGLEGELLGAWGALLLLWTIGRRSRLYWLLRWTSSNPRT